MKKLSIIVPVYNVELFVGRCLESCVNQDIAFDDYEIIVVNDETPDNSMDVVKEYCLRYPHIRIVNRKNGGLSAARNTGLKEAQGKYVWFIDSDDRIEHNCLGHLITKLETDNLDVLCFGLKLDFPDGHTIIHPVVHDGNEKIHTGRRFICSVGVAPAAWAAIFRRDFLLDHNLTFYEGILHEDQEFTPRAYCLANRIEYTDTPIYYYYQREGSIMKSKRNGKRCRDLLTVADSLYKFAQKHLESDSAPYKAIMGRVYFCVSQSLAFYSSDIFPLSTYRSKPYYPMNTAFVDDSLKNKLRLANISLRLYTLIYKLLKK